MKKKPERADDGRFVQKHTEYNKDRFIAVEAQHLREGMLIETIAGLRRVVAVNSASHVAVYGFVAISYEGNGVTQRKPEEPVIVDTEDLPTALILALGVPHKKMGVKWPG